MKKKKEEKKESILDRFKHVKSNIVNVIEKRLNMRTGRTSESLMIRDL